MHGNGNKYKKRIYVQGVLYNLGAWGHFDTIIAAILIQVITTQIKFK
jgi:hypothetical protein